MFELRLELQPFYDDREPKNARVQRSARTPRSNGWSSSSYSSQRESALKGPSVPRRSATLAEDTFEFGASRITEFEF